MPYIRPFTVIRRCSLTYRLPASHGENRGSSPLGSAKPFNMLRPGGETFALFLGTKHRLESELHSDRMANEFGSDCGERNSALRQFRLR